MVRNIMFNGDEIFGTRNKDGTWDLEITGLDSDSDGNSYEQILTIRGASIEIEMSTFESPNVNVKAGDIIQAERHKFFNVRRHN